VPATPQIVYMWRSITHIKSHLQAAATLDVTHPDFQVMLCYGRVAETRLSFQHTSRLKACHAHSCGPQGVVHRHVLLTLHGVKHMLPLCLPITLGFRHLSQQSTHISNAAGLVLLFETGLVLFDLADIVDGGPNTPTGTFIHQNRGEWLLASVSTHNMHPALWTAGRVRWAHTHSCCMYLQP